MCPSFGTNSVLSKDIFTHVPALIFITSGHCAGEGVDDDQLAGGPVQPLNFFDRGYHSVHITFIEQREGLKAKMERGCGAQSAIMPEGVNAISCAMDALQSKVNHCALINLQRTHERPPCGN